MSSADRSPQRETTSATQLRPHMRALRQALSLAEIDRFSRQITQKVLNLPQIKAAKTVFIYRSFQGEVATDPLISALRAQGKTLCYPQIQGEQMLAVAPQGEAFIRGAFGVLQPSTGESVTQIDVAIVPALACDLQKNRIGFGKGYYDRFLSQNPCYKIALCYDFQLLPAVPTHAKDVPMDAVITPTHTVE